MSEQQIVNNTERLAVIETRSHQLELEMLRVRERLHELESDRATVKLLVKQVSDLATNIERIAESAAAKAVEKAFEKRSEVTRRVRSLYVAYLTAGIAAGGLVTSFALQLHNHT